MIALIIFSFVYSKYFEGIKPSWRQFISAPLPSRAIEWSLKSLTIIVIGTYHFLKSIRLMTERNGSGSWSSGHNLGGLEVSSEETWFPSSWSWEIRIKFDSSRRFCFSIWLFNSLTSVLRWCTSCFDSLTVTGFERLDS